MTSQSHKPPKPTKPPIQDASLKPSSTATSPSLSSHLAMVELKQKILNALSKLADRDTQQIAFEDLEKIVQSLSSDGVSMFLNCLYDAVNDPKPAVKKEVLRLFPVLCAAHSHTAATHLTKIIAHIVKRLKDTDSLVREACLDATGLLARLYLKGGCGGDAMISLFVKPLLESMSENNKAAQGGAALGFAKVVECAADPPMGTFQKLLPRVCKYLNSPNFMAKASLLQVVSTMSQVGAVTPQSLELLLQSIHPCLCSSDWATRKAAADTLTVLGLKTSSVTEEAAASTLKVLETCRFDKIKPVRDSMNEALLLWKRIAGKADGSSDEHKFPSQEYGDACESADASYRKDVPNVCDGERGKGNNISDKAAGILKKKAPSLSYKELNPEFFQKLETRVSGDLPVEVILPRRCANASNSDIMEGSGSSSVQNVLTGFNCEKEYGHMARKIPGDNNHDQPATVNEEFPRNPEADGLVNDKGNWLAIQRQLSLLERQQAHLMNMLQDTMGGSHDSMATLENRVRGLERVVEDMRRDSSVSSTRRGIANLVGVDGSSNRYLSRYNGFNDYSGVKLGRGNDGRVNFSSRFTRGPSWRSDSSNSWNLHAYGRNGSRVSRRGGLGGVDADIRSGKPENDADHVSSRRAWEMEAGAEIRFGEGPSARSVWQASKDEATLEAIRIAGEDNAVGRGARVSTADDVAVKNRNSVWSAWDNAMDALHGGDFESAFAQVLSIGDEALFVKLIGISGPVLDQLSNETASEAVSGISELLMDQNVFDTCLCWIQQLADIVMENGPDVVCIPMEVKREILVNLHDSTSLELPRDWQGPAPDQLLLVLASAWGINLQDLGK